ncbi:MAG: OB-fold domain-containing protein [Chloroflexi bacterium]|nr:OB-fold domain-containing protein [Chloroflexota bacterium]
MPEEKVVTKPLPEVTSVDREFWDSIQKDVFKLQKCLDCNRLQFFPRPVCVHCFSSHLGWQESKGTGKIYSFTSVFVPVAPAFAKQVQATGKPVLFVLVDLDEGLRVYGEVVGAAAPDLKIGSPVRVSFETVEGTSFKLPKFRLSSA